MNAIKKHEFELREKKRTIIEAQNAKKRKIHNANMEYRFGLDWYNIVEGTEFDSDEAAKIRDRIEFEKERDEYLREEAYDKQCEANRLERDAKEKAYARASVVEKMLMNRVKDEEREDLDDDWDSMPLFQWD